MPEVTLHPDEDLVFDGGVHHCTPLGDRHANKFWYRLHATPFPHGWWGHWALDGGEKKHKWQAEGIASLSAEELQLLQQQSRAEKQEFAKLKQEHAKQRRAEVYSRYLSAGLVTEPHGYLVDKDITDVPTDWKQLQHSFRRPSLNPVTGKTETQRVAPELALMLPLRTVAAPTFQGAQYLAADGAKDFAAGLPVKGLCYPFGTVVGGNLCT
jgi:phage/plasmid primase-like uncharacterized protein